MQTSVKITCNIDGRKDRQSNTRSSRSDRLETTSISVFLCKDGTPYFLHLMYYMLLEISDKIIHIILNDNIQQKYM